MTAVNRTSAGEGLQLNLARKSRTSARLWTRGTASGDQQITALSKLEEDDQQPVAPHACVTDGGLNSDWTTYQSTSKTSESGNQGTTRLRVGTGQTTPNSTEALDWPP